MRSADSGRTWTVSSTSLPPTAILLLSCGDALHCMAVTNWSGIEITTTSDGGVTGRQTAAPRSWPQIPTDLSCAKKLNCFIAASDYKQLGSAHYEHPAIEATYDGGSAWTTIHLPAGPGSPFVVVWPLSCPSPADCIGLAATGRQSDGRRVIITNLPARASPRSEVNPPPGRGGICGIRSTRAQHQFQRSCQFPINHSEPCRGAVVPQRLLPPGVLVRPFQTVRNVLTVMIAVLAAHQALKPASYSAVSNIGNTWMSEE